MKRAVARYALIAAAVLPGAPASKAAPIVNEVLANEPGGQTSLEWIELHNPDDTAVALDSWTLDVSGDRAVTFPPGTRMDADAFFIICRRLYAGGASVGFESVWGDSSDTWGDCEVESTMPVPLEASFSLVNSSGYVALVDPTGAERARLSWTESGADGVSWELVELSVDSVAQCLDPRGGTPGARNSTSPVPHDLALRLLAVRALDGAAAIACEVVNLGIEPPGRSSLAFSICDDSGCTATYPLDSITILPPAPGESVAVDLSYTFVAMYTRLVGSLPADDRRSNDSVTFVAPGRNYPPLLLSEFLANPDNELETEWIECYNRDDTSIDLSGWQVGDSRSAASFAMTPAAALPPHAFLIAAQDTFAFRDYYPDCDALLLQPSPWPTLNNAGDSVRLIGPHEIEADRFAYTSTFDFYRTWCREPGSGESRRWGSSRSDGGTPGAPNELTPTTEATIGLSCTPRIFAPDRGEATTIAITTTDLPATIRLFDRQGRVVRSFGQVTGAVAWQGRSNSGRPLPVGIYIVVAEDESGESARETEVIAR